MLLVTYLLRATWHIRPQHNPANHLCQLQPFVPHSSSSISLSAILLHVVLGLPRFRRPSGAQVNAVLQSLFGSFLMMWPMNFNLLLRTSSLTFSISAIFRTSLFVILSCQRTLRWFTTVLMEYKSTIFNSFEKGSKLFFPSLFNACLSLLSFYVKFEQLNINKWPK